MSSSETELKKILSILKVDFNDAINNENAQVSNINEYYIIPLKSKYGKTIILRKHGKGFAWQWGFEAISGSGVSDGNDAVIQFGFTGKVKEGTPEFKRLLFEMGIDIPWYNR